MDSMLQHMTIIGVILSFRQLLYGALNSQLGERIPFLYGTIKDVHEHNAGAQVEEERARRRRREK